MLGDIDRFFGPPFPEPSGDPRVDPDSHADRQRDDNHLNRESERNRGQRVLADLRDKYRVHDIVAGLDSHRYNRRQRHRHQKLRNFFRSHAQLAFTRLRLSYRYVFPGRRLILVRLLLLFLQTMRILSASVVLHVYSSDGPSVSHPVNNNVYYVYCISF